jgi:membrane protein DedA with SNARE-associated domain
VALSPKLLARAMEEIELRVLEFVRDTYNMMGWPGVVMLMAIESTSIPLPSEVIMPLSGWMLIRDKGLSAAYVVMAGFYGALGSTIGSVAMYWLGLWGGRPFLQKYGKYLLISNRDIDAADHWFERFGDAAVFISRLLPIVRSFVSFAAGVARMRFGHFIIYTFVGAFIWCMALAYGGYVLGEHWEQIGGAIRPFYLPIFLACAVLVALYILRHLKELRTEL